VCLDEVENQSIALATVLFYPEILGALKTNYLCYFKWYYSIVNERFSIGSVVFRVISRSNKRSKLLPDRSSIIGLQ
jgi:hypothetical protein